MPDIVKIIIHNKTFLHQTDRKTQTVDKLCNCRNPSTCPLEGRCKEGPIMCKATLTSLAICKSAFFCLPIILASVSNLVLFNFAKKLMAYYGSCEIEIKVDTIITSKASSLKRKNTPENSRKDLECQKCGRNPINGVVHCKTCATLS